MTVAMFPGQGTQFKGMGSDFWHTSQDVAERASKILGYSITELCLSDPDNLLSLTQYTQPAIYVVNALAYYRWRDLGHEAAALIGHSLGEYSALLAAECFDFETGLRLVQKRGALMGAAGGGGMAAVINCPADVLETLLKSNGLNGIDSANYNSPTQIVIAGPTDLLQKASTLLSERRIRCIMLNVSAPFHSRYMRRVQEEFAEFLHGFRFTDPGIPVISNATARPYGPGEVASLLVRQIAEPVRWIDTIRALMGWGYRDFVEIGGDPSRMGGAVLSKLVEDIRRAERTSVV